MEVWGVGGRVVAGVDEGGVGVGVVANASEVGAMGGVEGGGSLVLHEVESLNGYTMMHQ